jgi:hypothetical protein
MDNKDRNWIASKKTAVSEMQEIQKKFDNKVDVSWFHDGHVAVYPAWSGKRSMFDHFMAQTNSFTQDSAAPNKV